jgi:hypothetical protein
MEYDNTNRGVLFQNDSKDSQTSTQPTRAIFTSAR